MIDRNKLTQARTWSARVNRDSIDMTHRFNENTLAAAEIINKLPSEIVDGEHIRELIDNYEAHSDQLGITPSDIARRKVNRSLISDLRALLPQPTLMSKIEWDDSEHHLAEVEVVGSRNRLIMLAPEADDDGDYTGIIYCANDIGETEGWYAHVLNLTGRKYTLSTNETTDAREH